MNKRAKLVLALLVVALAGSLAAILSGRERTESPVARISQGGQVLEEIALDQVERPYTIEVDSGAGHNTVLVEPGRIRVSQADCPDQVCVNQGYISDGSVPIVCLPHSLLIEIVGGGGTLDGAAG